GDRFLTWAAFDFPYSSGTCPSAGYTMGYEVETSAGSSLGSQCAPSFSPSSGDSMELTENLACGGTIGSLCLTLADLTLGRSYTPAVSQPTPTATYFQNTNPAAPNSHQYFTGAETIVDDALAPSGCLSFSGMPTVTYYLQGELPTSSGSGPGFQEENLSSYQVFASETDPTPALCASYLSSVERAPSTILTQYLPGGGVSDGAHWLAFQNWTRAVGRASMGRFQTDVFPVTGSMKESRTSGDDGQYLVANVTAGGGVPPYACQWSVDGATLAGTACSVNLTVNGNGPENLSAFAIDAARDDALAWTTFTAYADPTVAVPIASPSSVDLGQSVRFSATVVGGSGGVTYAWSGLPSGCT
ncbi:MAG: hypothetical protein L3J91_00770, partial [Thermoplasmata archaeon]|nr:hypothetical protein [Thermoplasmata archaeon]